MGGEEWGRGGGRGRGVMGKREEDQSLVLSYK